LTIAEGKHARELAGVAVATVILSAAIGTDAQDTKLSLPNVTVTAPAPPIVPPYQRECNGLSSAPGDGIERGRGSTKRRIHAGAPRNPAPRGNCGPS